MRRGWLVLLPTLGILAALAGQDVRVSVNLVLSEATTNEPPRPIIFLRGLLADPAWTKHLDNSLPLIVTHRLELWRSRDGWIDELRRDFEWQAVVTKEPLQEEYAVTLVRFGKPERPERFSIRDSAAAYLQRGNKVEIVPNRSGRYYYRLTTRITALSDADMDQLERFLEGDPLDQEREGTAFGKWVRRQLLRLAGLPSEVLQARSDEFDVRRDDE